MRRAGALLLVLLMLSAWGRFAGGEEEFDKYGGTLSVGGHPGDSFHLEKIGKRWWLVTPEGHGTFIRAVSKVDIADYGGAGGFLAYDAVYLQRAGSTSLANLQEAAESGVTGDVVHPITGATLKTRGDALYLGSSRFKPNYTYFWLDRLGKGGAVKWYYSTAEGFQPIGDKGVPQGGASLNDDGSWNLDIGNYLAPDEHGFGKWGNLNANRIVWWDMSQGFPADFAAVELPGDPVRRYYVMAVAQHRFTVPPVLNQTYERADLGEWIAKKYSPGDFYGKWAAAMTQRLRGWGFNAAGMYSPKYLQCAAGQADRLPGEPTWDLGGWATKKNRPYHVKNVYAGAVFPPGSKKLSYQGLQPDVFEPAFEKAYMEMVLQQKAAKDAWSWALICEEADYLFGLGSLAHDHLGYVALAQNPYQPKASREGQEMTYEDPRLYCKYALRDFLRDRYRTTGEQLPAFTNRSAVPCYTYARNPAAAEQAALQNLNAAWGTHYATWDTSSGDLLSGDNAWGSGTGFMDENGKRVLAKGIRSPGFNQQFTDPAHAAVRKDLDDFLALFAAHYGAVLEKAFAQVPHPMLLMPLYNGPDFVYKALAPYVDGFWVNVPDAQRALQIYNAAHKPLLVADYLTADPDSPLYFKAKIESLRYDAASGNTIITAPDLRYVFRKAHFIAFPDCREVEKKGTSGGKHVAAHPRIKAAHWNVLEVPGDYTAAVKPGMHVEMWKPSKRAILPTQEDRARAMTARYESLLNLRGDDGICFVIGIEHWCLYDPAVSNWGDDKNFGLATLQDNAYDGVEARQPTGTDPRGYPIGGEDADYGNVLGGVSEFLRNVYDRIER